jgi:hypothetical protein
MRKLRDAGISAGRYHYAYSDPTELVFNLDLPVTRIGGES